MSFSTLTGNDIAKKLLTSLAQDPSQGRRVLLFTGLGHIDKKAFVIAFLSLLFGEKHEEKIAQAIHPDVQWLQPEGKLRLHTVDSMQTLIRDALLSPREASYKAYIIEEADRMLPSSSNALLKLLEEPPLHDFFILLSSREEDLLPTIRSRCFCVPFSAEEEVLTDSPFVAKMEELLDLFLQGSFSSHWNDVLGELDKLFEKAGEKSPVGQEMEKLLDILLLRIRDLHYQQAQAQELNPCLPPLDQAMILLAEARVATQRSMKPRVVLEHLFRKLYQRV